MFSISILIFIATFFLAYSNGANDTFKGVATLYGSNIINFRGAVRWAAVTTFLGSIASIYFAETLVKNFSGKGLVPDAVAASPEFIAAVGLGAGMTVFLASMTGFPISTTHSLTGALTGSGLIAVGSRVNFSTLGSKFFLPLLFSPFLALSLAVIVYKLMRNARISMGATKEMCICVGKTEKIVPVPEPVSAFSFTAHTFPEITVDSRQNCTERYGGTYLGIHTQKFIDIAHFVSAGIVSFARGLNDTPKIVALLVTFNAFDIHNGLVAVAVGMAAGGLLNARKVAETMSHKITPMNQSQGFSANIVTGFLVILASRLGMPVSTTHVSVGSLFGIGLISGQANKRVVSEIILSWVLTLPIAALLSAATYQLLSALL